jgi:K+ transporter
MDALQAWHDTAAISPENFFKTLHKLKIPRVPGTAVFLTRLAWATPPLMVRHV